MLTNRHPVRNSLAVTNALSFSFHYETLAALAVSLNNFDVDNAPLITCSYGKVSLNGLRLAAGSGPVTRIQTVMTLSWLRLVDPTRSAYRRRSGNGHEKREEMGGASPSTCRGSTSSATSSPGAPAPWPCCYRAAHG